MKKAPKKLSTAMRIALNDLRKVEKDPRYKVNMATWHSPSYPSADASVTLPCEVCFAGAVMAKTHNLPTHVDFLDWQGMTPAWQKIFDALDEVRKGYVSDALTILGRDEEKASPIFVPVTHYRVDPIQFRKDMFKIVHALEKIGE